MRMARSPKPAPRIIGRTPRLDLLTRSIPIYNANSKPVPRVVTTKAKADTEVAKADFFALDSSSFASVARWARATKGEAKSASVAGGGGGGGGGFGGGAGGGGSGGSGYDFLE
jgi:hypothetical protein